MNYWKLGAFAAIIVAIAFGVWHVTAKLGDLKLEQLKNAQQAETIKAENAALKQNQTNAQTTNEVSHDYEAKLSALYAANPVVVQQSNPVAHGYMPNVSAASGGSNAAACSNAGADRQALKLKLKKEILKLTELQAWVSQIQSNMSQ